MTVSKRKADFFNFSFVWTVESHFCVLCTILLIFRSNEERILHDADNTCTIKSNGEVYSSRSTLLETSCEIDITEFPVDEQTCHFDVRITPPPNYSCACPQFTHGQSCAENTVADPGFG